MVFTLLLLYISCSFEIIIYLVMDYLDRPMVTRMIFGSHYGRIGNRTVPNREMIQVVLFWLISDLIPNSVLSDGYYHEGLFCDVFFILASDHASGASLKT